MAAFTVDNCRRLYLECDRIDAMTNSWEQNKAMTALLVRLKRLKMDVESGRVPVDGYIETCQAAE